MGDVEDHPSTARTYCQLSVLDAGLAGMGGDLPVSRESGQRVDPAAEGEVAKAPRGCNLAQYSFWARTWHWPPAYTFKSSPSDGEGANIASSPVRVMVMSVNRAGLR